MNKLDKEKIKIRLANDEDLSQIIQLLADDELGKSRENHVIDGNVPECYTKAFNLIKASTDNQLIVMEYDGNVIGTLQLIIIPTLTLQGCIRAEVEGVRIKSEFRGAGLGKLMFDWVKQLAIDNGCRLLQLTTNKNRLEAQEFYKNIGFVDSHCGMKMVLNSKNKK